ncbi:MAG: HAMP domain-containing histidine kinase [Planctomycetes bacterium]|nr:HAMP domain-containing histidine kinase [Planctomycetota bacterium]
MDRPVRIAVVGPVDDRLLADLRALPLQPDLRQWPTLLDASDAIVPFQADLLLLQLGPVAAEEIGALRLLRNLWPTLGVVLVTDAAHELQQAPFAARLGLQLLVHPGAPGQLAAALELARHGSTGPRPEVFQDLARGVADEVNNPLMFTAGHLQLLRGSLDPQREAARRAQVDAVLQGLARVQTAVDRLRLVAEAARGPTRHEPVDLAALLAQAVATREPGRAAATLRIADGNHVVRGDPEQLAAALGTLVQFAGDLAELGAVSHLELDVLAGGRRLRLTASGPPLAAFQVPHGFEPFYPSRALRTPGLGLGPFLVQTVFLGHRGQASVRRTRDGALQFDFVLPA